MTDKASTDKDEAHESNSALDAYRHAVKQTHARTTKLWSVIIRHRTTAITMAIGLIAGPIVGAILIDYVSITPKRLAGLLEDAKVSEFNHLRTQFKQPIIRKYRSF